MTSARHRCSSLLMAKDQFTSPMTSHYDITYLLTFGWSTATACITLKVKRLGRSIQIHDVFNPIAIAAVSVNHFIKRAIRPNYVHELEKIHITDLCNCIEKRWRVIGQYNKQLQSQRDSIYKGWWYN